MCQIFVILICLCFLLLEKKTDPSKVTSKTSLSSVPSNLTKCSSPSTLTIPSYGERSESLPTPQTEGEILLSANLKAFSFNDLRNATRNFRPDSLLGEGGFGYVYKGWINEQTLAPSRPGSGMVVAVKKLKPEGFQGHREWLVILSEQIDFSSVFWLHNFIYLFIYFLIITDRGKLPWSASPPEFG